MLSVARSRKAELEGRPLLGMQARPGAASGAPAAQSRIPGPVPSPNSCRSTTSRRSFPVGSLCLGCECSKLPEASPGIPVHQWPATWCARWRRTTVWAAGRGGAARDRPGRLLGVKAESPNGACFDLRAVRKVTCARGGRCGSECKYGGVSIRSKENEVSLLP